MNAKCRIEGMFKQDSHQALQVASDNGAWGAQSYSQEKINRNESGAFFDNYKPAKEGYITFELFGNAPFSELHRIAKLVCEYDYTVSVEQNGDADK